MKNLDLTLAICMYNAEQYIEETLQSVLAQTMQDFNLLIVDDCSTDNSVAVVKHFFKGNPRQYELFSLEANGGIAKARNFVLSHTKTKYLLFVDSDDLFEADLVKKEYETISSDVDLIGVSCWSQYINVKGEKIHGGTFLGEKEKGAFIEKASKRKLIFLPIHTMFSVEYARKVGGFSVEGFSIDGIRYQDYCEELDLWTRMSDFYIEGKSLITIPQVLYYYRKRDGLSSNHFNMIIKMRYTKANLLRRRLGEKEMNFVEFYSSLNEKTLKKYKNEAISAEALRNGVFYLKKKNVFMAIYLVLKSVAYNPSYLFDKLKHSLKIKK